MFEINGIDLKKTLLFDNITFKVPKGISVLYGLNQTSAKTSGNGNAAGKSALVSQFGEILFQEPIVGKKQDAVKSGLRRLHMKFDELPVNLTRINTKTELLIDGKKTKLRTKAFYKQWLDANLPITKMEYDTYVHLDARVPHPLVMGSSTERKKFFTQFFGLDKMDVERRLFLAELNTLQRTRAAYNELSKEYARVKDSALSDDERSVLTDKVKIKRARLTDLQGKATKLANIAQLLQFEANSSEQLEALYKLLDTREVDESEYDNRLDITVKNLRENKERLADAERYERYLVERSAFDKAVAELDDSAKAFVDEHGTNEATAIARKRARSYRDAVSELEQVDANVKRLTRVVDRDIASEFKVKVSKDARDYDENALIAERKALNHQLSHAEKFKRGQCETCGQDVAIKSPKKLQQRIDAIDAMLDAVEQREAYKTARLKQKEAKDELGPIHAEQTRLGVIVAKNKKYVKLARQLVELPERPRKFDGSKMEVKVLQRMVDEDREALQLLKLLRPNLDTIIALGQLNDKQRQSGKIARKLHETINDLQEFLSRTDSRLAIDDVRRADMKALRKRLRKLKEELADEEALKILIEGYSDKEMKRMAVRLISRRLMIEVNKYARSVFPEDYEFDFEWKSSNLNMIVHRRYDVPQKNGKTKKKVKSSDVRKLSGAESKLFTIVLVMALLTFVPASRRCNLMILDEPSANMSPETLRSFQDLLPLLNQIIPSIIVVTPDSTERYRNAKEFTMIKVNGVGRLVDGHPELHKKRIRA